VVGQRQWQNGTAGLDRRLQQGSVKTEQMGSVACRSLRKNGDIHASIQQGIDFCIDYLGVTAAAPAQENGVVFFAQPAKERPLAYLGLGDEGGRSQGMNGEDIEPGDMIGYNQATRGRIGRLRLQANGKNPEYLVRPALF